MDSLNPKIRFLNRTAITCVLATSCLGSLPLQASVLTPITLTDGPSTAIIDLTSGAGMYHWDLGFGGNQLAQQWFYYRWGNGPAQAINTIGAPNIIANTANLLSVSYANTQFEVTISYFLNGAVGTADIFEAITVKNLDPINTLQNFNLFQYSDFNLLGTPGGDSVTIDPAKNFVTQTEGISVIGEAITDPYATHAEAGLNGSILANLAGFNYDLNDSLAAGPGDVSWAFQWKANIDGGQTLEVIKDKRITLTAIPEPTVTSIIALGLGLLTTLARRKV